MRSTRFRDKLQPIQSFPVRYWMTVFLHFPLTSPTAPPIVLPPVERAVPLLDMDRTLLDIAPIPDSVAVAPDLLEILLRLRAACGDSPAVVTGRPVEQINQLLGDIPYAVAGEHGGACDTHRARRSSASRCLRRRTSGWRKSPPSRRRTLMICWSTSSAGSCCTIGSCLSGAISCERPWSG